MRDGKKNKMKNTDLVSIILLNIFVCYASVLFLNKIYLGKVKINSLL